MGLKVLLSLIVLLLSSCIKAIKPVDILNFYYPTAPYSADPLEYDYSAHHAIYKSVFSTLTSQYATKGTQGILAKSWESTADKKQWTIRLRKDLSFEDGTPITAKIIIKSLTRIAWKLKEKGSKDNFLELAEGYSNLNSASDSISGISEKDGTIVFKFTQPVKGFLNSLSFGIYGIVHPSNFNQNSGDWLKEVAPISSGAYRVAKGSHDKSLSLILNESYPKDLGHPHKFKKILVSWSKEDSEDADIYRGTSLNTIPNEEYQFSGGVESGIAYLRCQSWSAPDSICHSKEQRIILRDSLYKKLERDGIIPKKSFFPMSMKGINEVRQIAVKNEKPAKHNIRYRNFSNHNFNFWKKLEKNLNEMGGTEVDVPMKIVGKEFTAGLHKYSLDICGIATGILIEDPDDDIRFMFRSKAGIRLPDTDGTILPMLDAEKLDVQKINQKIWDQAVIWPIAHFANGLFYKKHVDIHLLNILQPPMDFTWIGQK